MGVKMSLKKYWPEMVLGGTLVVLSLGLPQTIANVMGSSREFRRNAYNINVRSGVWPFSYRNDKTFRYQYNELASKLRSSLQVSSESGVCYTIEDTNGDFKPDMFYQSGITLYREDNQDVFKNYVDKVWKKDLESLNVLDVHKEWVEKHGKFLLRH